MEHCTLDAPTSATGYHGRHILLVTTPPFFGSISKLTFFTLIFLTFWHFDRTWFWLSSINILLLLLFVTILSDFFVLLLLFLQSFWFEACFVSSFTNSPLITSCSLLIFLTSWTSGGSGQNSGIIELDPEQILHVVGQMIENSHPDFWIYSRYSGEKVLDFTRTCVEACPVLVHCGHADRSRLWCVCSPRWIFLCRAWRLPILRHFGETSWK